MKYKIPLLSLIAISSLYASPLSVEKIVVNSSACADDGSIILRD